MSLSFTAARALLAAPMSADAVADVLDLLLAGSLAEAEGAELLTTWSGRGETAVELAALVRLLRERAVRVAVPPSLDLCGTGGSGLTRFNVSTTAAFIIAAAGVPVGKHGNFGSTRPNGSFNLLDELGVRYDLEPEAQAQLQQETGLCFFFARRHHPAVGAVVPYRKAAGCRTIFNLAGPLANPGEVRCQLIGVAKPELAEVVIGGLQELGLPGALVVHGAPGIDEWSVVGPTRWWLLRDGQVSEGDDDAPAYPSLQHGDLPGGDAPENAVTFRQLLDGTITGPLRDMVCTNAGIAIDLWQGREPGARGEGFEIADKLLASGEVAATFAKHQSLAAELASS